MHPCVHCSVIYNGQEAAHSPTNRQVDKKDAIYRYTHTHMCVYTYILCTHTEIYAHTLEYYLAIKRMNFHHV